MRSSVEPAPASLFLLLLILSPQACSLSCSGPSAQPPVQHPSAASQEASISTAVPAPSPSPSAVAVKGDRASEDQILLAVSQALRRSKLLTHPDPCYAYRFDAAAGQPAYTVDVRENHQHAECGGDPATQPHLFTVHVDKKTRALSEDSRSPGAFQPLQP